MHFITHHTVCVQVYLHLSWQNFHSSQRLHSNQILCRNIPRYWGWRLIHWYLVVCYSIWTRYRKCPWGAAVFYSWWLQKAYSNENFNHRGASILFFTFPTTSKKRRKLFFSSRKVFTVFFCAQSGCPWKFSLAIYYNFLKCSATRQVLAILSRKTPWIKKSKNLKVRRCGFSFFFLFFCFFCMTQWKPFLFQVYRNWLEPQEEKKFSTRTRQTFLSKIEILQCVGI